VVWEWVSHPNSTTGTLHPNTVSVSWVLIEGGRVLLCFSTGVVLQHSTETHPAGQGRRVVRYQRGESTTTRLYQCVPINTHHHHHNILNSFYRSFNFHSALYPQYWILSTLNISAISISAQPRYLTAAKLQGRYLYWNIMMDPR
jgi:hypothetical protein